MRRVLIDFHWIIYMGSKRKSFTSGEVLSHLFYVLTDHVTSDPAASQASLVVTEVGVLGIIIAAFALDQRRKVREVDLSAVLSK